MNEIFKAVLERMNRLKGEEESDEKPKIPRRALASLLESEGFKISNFDSESNIIACNKSGTNYLFSLETKALLLNVIYSDINLNLKQINELNSLKLGKIFKADDDNIVFQTILPIGSGVSKRQVISFIDDSCAQLFAFLLLIQGLNNKVEYEDDDILPF